MTSQFDLPDEPRSIREFLMKIRLFVGLVALGLSFPVGAQVSRGDWFPGSSSVTEMEIIPPGFRGKWAPNLANCADRDGVSHMYVYPNGIDFYESGGRLDRISQAGQERAVLMKLSFEGEGGFWDRVWRVTLGANGQTITISLQDGSEVETYVRCPTGS